MKKVHSVTARNGSKVQTSKVHAFDLPVDDYKNVKAMADEFGVTVQWILEECIKRAAPKMIADAKAAKAANGKPVRYSTTRFPKQGEEKSVNELLEIPDEEIPDDTIEDYLQLPSHTQWQWKEIRRRILEHEFANNGHARRHEGSPVSVTVNVGWSIYQRLLMIGRGETPEVCPEQLILDTIEEYAAQIHACDKKDGQ